MIFCECIQEPCLKLYDHPRSLLIVPPKPLEFLVHFSSKRLHHLHFCGTTFWSFIAIKSSKEVEGENVNSFCNTVISTSDKLWVDKLITCNSFSEVCYHHFFVHRYVFVYPYISL